MNKTYLSANDLLKVSYTMAKNIINSGFKPDFIVAIWRGGTPVGIAVQELMEYVGIKTDHIAIRTSYYKSIGKKHEKVRVHNLGYLVNKIEAYHKLLIIDNVFDTGRSIEALLIAIRHKARKNTPEQIKIATPYFKPEQNQTAIEPDFFIKKTNNWLVFPHELCGLSQQEVIENKPMLIPILKGLVV